MKSRLRILTGLVLLAGLVPAPTAEHGATLLLPQSRPTPYATAGGEPFLDLGPMLGHVSSTNALIWAAASRPARLGVRIGQQTDFADARELSGTQLVAENACMGVVSVQGLRPAERYLYCLLLDGRPAMTRPYPSFTTAPVEGAAGRVRFAFTSCVGHHGYNAAPGYADLATRTNFDLLLMLGDNHYANTSDAPKQLAYYADQRRQPGWRELTARAPVYAIWDDHDYGPDNSDGLLRGKETSLATFRRVWANPAYGTANDPGVYFKFTRAGVDFFMLDGRYHRSPNKAPDGPGKTLLGERQLAWLKRELQASTAPIKVVASGGEWQSNGTDDSWTRFQHERDDLFQFIQEHAIEGILFLSGDRHFTGAYQVKGRWIEVTAGPLGSSNATSKDLPEMFLNFSPSKAKYYCVYDVDTRPATPRVTLEVYRVGEGLLTRRLFTWDEVSGTARIAPLQPGVTGKP